MTSYVPDFFSYLTLPQRNPNSTEGHLNNLGSSRVPKFKAIGLLVLEKKTFLSFAIYGHGGRLGHVTQLIYTNL